MKRHPTINDLHLINQCINILPIATEKTKVLAAVDVSHDDGNTWKQKLTFQRKATPTVMPEVFNYQ
jgi:hypothetical protein